jgi:ketosteroid isomerase-like protein
MADYRRPLADRVEVSAPRLAAFVAQILTRLPESIRRRALRSAFDRARDAFNRGDLEVVFALFAADVTYSPPPPLHEGGSLQGRGAVFDFWRGIFTRYDENTIENLSLDEVSSESLVRRARLHHRSRTNGESLDYMIVQITDLKRGRVARQMNILDDPQATGP